MEDLNIKVIDEDHILINFRQFISLSRVVEMVEGQRGKEPGTENEGANNRGKNILWQGVSTEPVCHFCGKPLSEIRYHGDKKYRHCYSCHFDQYEL